jgi:tRNA A-37 threonylcarbamoyl transferase component Bud32
MGEVKPGDVLAGKYRVEQILGEGGMGFVVAATHITLEERVALKFMRAEAMAQQDGAQRFLREARAAVKLKSSHVARVLDVGTLETGAPYIVMEHLDGADLAHVLAARGALPLPEVVDYLLQACDAIAEAHSIGIIHRDLKPANVFVTTGRDGAPLVKVLDFGISKVNVLGDRPESMTSSATLLGSPVYMSPEQMKSSRDVDVTADIWSLGIILYEAVGGRVPFDEQTMGALMAKVLTEPPPSLHILRPDLPTAFLDVVGRCLEKEPGRRYASVGEFAVGLLPFGPPSSEERVARILSLGRGRAGSGPGSASALPSAPLATSSSAMLGVAATQALPEATTGATAVPARKPWGLYAAIALAGVVVAAAAFMGTRTLGHAGPVVASEGSAAPESTTTAPSRGSTSPVSHADTPPTPAASAAPAPLSESPSSTPSATPKRLATRVTKSPKLTEKPASTKPASQDDPFGTSRQ